MTRNILIVDDSSAIRKILQRVLRQAEIPVGAVHEAGDGLEAIEMLRTRPIHLVLSDINMPNMDGLELLARIRSTEAWQDLPVVLITTEGGQTKIMEAAHLGASGYVRKPFTADQIKEKLSGFF